MQGSPRGFGFQDGPWHPACTLIPVVAGECHVLQPHLLLAHGACWAGGEPKAAGMGIINLCGSICSALCHVPVSAASDPCTHLQGLPACIPVSPSWVHSVSLNHTGTLQFQPYWNSLLPLLLHPSLCCWHQDGSRSVQGVPAVPCGVFPCHKGYFLAGGVFPSRAGYFLAVCCASGGSWQAQPCPSSAGGVWCWGSAHPSCYPHRAPSQSCTLPAPPCRRCGGARASRCPITCTPSSSR